MGGTDPGLALVLQPYCVICVHMDRENTITLGEKGDRILQWMKNNMLV